jgi:peroxiredoxin
MARPRSFQEKQPVKKILLAALAGGALLLLLLATAPLRQGPGVEAGQKAPDFTLARLQGGLASLSDYSGKVVLINFWATWCKDCRREMPELDALFQKLKDRGFVVLAISMDEEGRKVVAPFIEKHGPTYPILLADRPTPAAYRIYGLPTSYLLDGKGVVVRRYVGPVKPEALENDILALLDRRNTS